MNTIATFLGSALRVVDGVASNIDWIILGLLFCSVLLLTYGVLAFFNPDRSVEKRIANVGGVPSDNNSKKSLRYNGQSTFWGRVASTLEKFTKNHEASKQSALRLKLMRAGYFHPASVHYYYIIRVGLALTIPILVVFVYPFLLPKTEITHLVLVSFLSGVFGLYVPLLFIRSKTENRQQLIVEGFPDALDMMLVCVEAGLGFDETLVRVSQKLENSHSVLSKLIGLVTLEIRAGQSRAYAFKSFANRCGVEDIQSFVTLLIQSEALGADFAQTLRVQASELRSKRMNRAEETAHKLPVKLTIPLIIFILPAMLAVVLAPAIISIIRTILPNL